MNSNAFHNIANLAMLAMAALEAGLLSTGCTTLTTGALDCHASWLPPMWAVWGIGGLASLKVVVNVVRDGFGGLFKTQPPVS